MVDLDMVGVKKVVVDKSQLQEKTAELLKSYHNVAVYDAGTPEHSRAGLAPDKVMVKAWNKRRNER